MAKLEPLIAATKADAFVIGATLLACPAALNAEGAAGWHPITYMSGTCVSKLLLSAGHDNSDKVISVTPLLDPADPNNASSPAMQLYMTNVKKYAPKADTADGLLHSPGYLTIHCQHDDQLGVTLVLQVLSAAAIGYYRRQLYFKRSVLRPITKNKYCVIKII
mgnify:CR=1 FL=1